MNAANLKQQLLWKENELSRLRREMDNSIGFFSYRGRLRNQLSNKIDSLEKEIKGLKLQLNIR